MPIQPSMRRLNGGLSAFLLDIGVTIVFTISEYLLLVRYPI